MNPPKTLTILIAAIFMLLLNSCGKDVFSCFDEQLYQKHKDDICTMDCPGVIGCDGKFYCNECIARTQGIRIRK